MSGVNPYAAVRAAILAKNPKGLLAGLAVVGDCGCVFGTTYGRAVGGAYESAANPDCDRLFHPVRDAAILDARRGFRVWAEGLGLSRAVIADIEEFNDTYGGSGEIDDIGQNEPRVCAERLAAVLAWLEGRAVAWAKENDT